MRLPDHGGTHQLSHDGSAVPPGALPGFRGQGEVRKAGWGAPDSRQGVCTCRRAGKGGDADISPRCDDGPSASGTQARTRGGTIDADALERGRRHCGRARVRRRRLSAGRQPEHAVRLIRMVLRSAVVVVAAFLALFVHLCRIALRMAIGLR